MKFLVDHQLPPVLASFLQNQGHTAQHARELGLKEASDIIIWRYAFERDMVVVSKDEDFFHLATTPNNRGKLVWVRIGNCRKQVLIKTFTLRFAQVVALLEAGHRIVEIR